MAHGDYDGRAATDTPLTGLQTSLSLIAGLRAHDHDAWRTFVALYAPLVVRWCHRQGLADADVADVAQEVFRRVSLDLVRFRKAGASDSFRGWLCRITHRQIADFFRRRHSVPPAQGGSAALSWLNRQPDRPLAEPDEEEARQEERYLFQQAVQMIRCEFSENHWQMFWRVTVDCVPAPVVAAEFGTSPAAVRQAKSRVLRRLREAVGEVVV